MLSSRRGLIALLVCAFAAIVVLQFPAHYQGDGHEYDAALEALANHGTPALEWADEAAVYGRATARADPVPPPPWGLDCRGRSYVWHFWMYPLACLPAKLLLRSLGADELLAFALTNAVLCSGATALVLLAAPWRVGTRIGFLGLCLLNPTVLYVTWPSPEVFTWSVCVVGIVLAERGHLWAPAAVGLGATQNPPVLLIAPLLAWHLARARGWMAGLKALLAGVAIAMGPAIFYGWRCGVPNPIVSMGAASPGYVSQAKVFDVFFDLTQGLLAYAPISLAARLSSRARRSGRRDRPARVRHLEDGPNKNYIWS